MKITPTGKLCSRCGLPDHKGYQELDTMCLQCFDTFVIAYLETSLAEAKVRLRAAKEHAIETFDRSF